MRPLAEWPARERARVSGVMADIDDTLTTQGQITEDALAALHALRQAGLLLVLVTGRPAGWSEPFAAAWPVHAIVAENGALALVPRLEKDPHPNPLPRAGEGVDALHSQRLVSLQGLVPVEKLYQQDAATRGANLLRMQQVAARILREVPGAVLARDSAGRETDIAVDHSEFTSLAAARMQEVLAIMSGEGMSASVSSIHINGWYGTHDKLSGARWILRRLFQRELDNELERWAYIGDSSNDQVMFEHFRHSVAVANIRRFAAELQHAPRFICSNERGAGFAEFAQALLEARAPVPASSPARGQG
jgi:hydroxymethylpyrimidine pyrophosphatase-like HAD family hydrolase